MKNDVLDKITAFLNEQLGNYEVYNNYTIDVDGDTMEVSCTVSDCEVCSVTFYVYDDKVKIRTLSEGRENLDFDSPVEFWKQWLWSALKYMRCFVPKDNAQHSRQEPCLLFSHLSSLIL